MYVVQKRLLSFFRMKPKKKSKYTDYFEIFKDKAICRVCGNAILCTNRQTSGMKYHAETVHKINFDDASETPEEKKPKATPTLDGFIRVKKPPLEELVSREAAKGVSFRYIAESELIHKGISSYGYKAPKSHVTVRKLVHKSAQTHRKIYRDKFQLHLKNGQRFCAIADEWTCPTKKRKYLNLILHLKGKFYYLPYI